MQRMQHANHRLGRQAVRWRGGIIRVVALAIALGPTVGAQTGAISGTVYRDSEGHAISDVTVSLMPIGAKAITNYAGEFRFSRVPTGQYQLILRRVGFAQLTDSIALLAGQTTDREYVLVVAPVALDSVRVAAPAPRYRSPLLQEFEQRMRAHQGGHFISDSVLRRDEARRLTDLITSYIPGLRTFRVQSGEYLTSARSPCARAFCAGRTCPVALFVDGLPVFNPGVLNAETPDLKRFSIANLSGIEFYAGGATIPPRFNATGSTCGVLLLWTRDGV